MERLTAEDLKKVAAGTLEDAQAYLKELMIKYKVDDEDAVFALMTKDEIDKFVKEYIKP